GRSAVVRGIIRSARQHNGSIVRILGNPDHGEKFCAVTHGDHHFALGVIVIDGWKLKVLVQIVRVRLLLRGCGSSYGKSSKTESECLPCKLHEISDSVIRGHFRANCGEPLYRL